MTQVTISTIKLNIGKSVNFHPYKKLFPWIQSVLTRSNGDKNLISVASSALRPFSPLLEVDIADWVKTEGVAVAVGIWVLFSISIKQLCRGAHVDVEATGNSGTAGVSMVTRWSSDTNVKMEWAMSFYGLPEGGRKKIVKIYINLYGAK